MTHRQRHERPPRRTIRPERPRTDNRARWRERAALVVSSSIRNHRSVPAPSDGRRRRGGGQWADFDGNERRGLAARCQQRVKATRSHARGLGAPLVDCERSATVRGCSCSVLVCRRIGRLSTQQPGERPRGHLRGGRLRAARGSRPFHRSSTVEQRTLPSRSGS